MVPDRCPGTKYESRDVPEPPFRSCCRRNGDRLPFRRWKWDIPTERSLMGTITGHVLPAFARAWQAHIPLSSKGEEGDLRLSIDSLCLELQATTRRQLANAGWRASNRRTLSAPN